MPDLEGIKAILITLTWVFLGFFSWFVIWRKMHNDYPEDEIIKGLLLLSLAGGLGWILASKIGISAPLLILWFVVLSLVWYGRLVRWDTWEWIDAIGILSLWTGVLASALRINWLPMTLLTVGLIFTGLIARNYRKFRWYKSGRVGLVGLFSLMWWTGTEVVVALARPVEIYWVGLQPTVWIAVPTIVILVVATYNRSRLKS